MVTATLKLLGFYSVNIIVLIYFSLSTRGHIFHKLYYMKNETRACRIVMQYMSHLLSLRLLLFCVNESSESSDETAHMHNLVRALAARQGNKYKIRMSKIKCWIIRHTLKVNIQLKNRSFTTVKTNHSSGLRPVFFQL